MNTISPVRFGLAVGATLALVYFGCVIVMLTAPRETAIWFFNSLCHGIDWRPVLRWDMPAWEAAVGFVEILILGWLLGAAGAAFYNLPVWLRRP